VKPSTHRSLWVGIFASFLAMAVFSAVPAFAATITVTSLADSGPGSLRAAIAAASPGDTINFSLTLPATITLTSGELLINKNLRISGPGASSLAISGDSLSRVFDIASGTVALSGLSIENGGNGSGNGGGIYNAGTLILSNSTVSGNSGGILNDTGGTLIVTNSTISDNNAYNAAQSHGGGIYNNNGATATLTNSTVSGNRAAFGAGIYNTVGALTVTNTTFSNNNSAVCCGGGNGGGIYSAGGTLAVTNSTFSGNISYYGGGIFNAGGTLNVSNSTFSANWANNNGNGIYNAASATLKNSIIASGTSGAPGGNCYFASGSFTSQGHNLSDDNSCSLTGPGDLNSTPAGLDPNGLQNNGGPTQTITLLTTSAAVDAIPLNPTNYCTDVNGASINTDQRGITRPQGSACDVGAFELVTDNDSQFSQLNGGNAFSGNQTVNGNVAATNFVGNGAGLTGVNAANSLALGGLPASNYARLDIGNTFNGNENVTGSVGASNVSAVTVNALALSATDITAGNNISAVNTVFGNNVAATNNLYGKELFASNNITVSNTAFANNVTAANNVLATKVIASGTVTIGTAGTPILEHLSATPTISVPPIAPSNCATISNVSVPGAADGDTLALGVKNSFVSGGSLNYFAWVSAPNTVTIRVCNFKGSTNSPITGAIRVDIWKH
jgi:hypothetical protein